MTETYPGPDTAAAQEQRSGAELRSLRRSSTDRVVAGVLGGLGQRLGIDPVVLRVTTAVLAVFGGVGILLYAIAWLLLPTDDGSGSVVEQALGRTTRSPGSIPVALGLSIVALVSSGVIVGGSWDGGLLLVLAVVGLALWLRRGDDPAPVTPPVWEPPHGYEPRYVDDAAWSPHYPEAPVAARESGRPGAEESLSDDERPTGARPDADLVPTATPGTAGWPDGPDWGPPPAAAPAYASAPPAAPARQRSVLGPVTVCAALVAVGALAINDVVWASVPPAMYVALALAVVAVGLLVGTRYGRSRGLVVLGIVLGLALVPTTLIGRWAVGPTVDTNVTITRVADVPGGVVSIGAGDTTYDLSGLALTDDDNIKLSIEQGAGELHVIVPENADVIVNGEVGAGDIAAFRQNSGGVGRETRITDDGADNAPGGGTIQLDLELGVGQIEVTR